MKHLSCTKGLFIALLLLMPIGIQAYDLEVDGIYYNLVIGDEITLEVTSGDEKYSGDIVIPETVTYNGRTCKVTSIEDEAFYDCDSLTSVESPNVKSIGEYAFYDCDSLTSVKMPNVTTIGEGVFYGCTSLTSVEFPNATSIGINLDEEILPGYEEFRGGYVFYGCTSLTNAIFPNATSIGIKQTFTGCIYNHRTTKTNQKYPSVNL